VCPAVGPAFLGIFKQLVENDLSSDSSSDSKCRLLPLAAEISDSKCRLLPLAAEKQLVENDQITAEIELSAYLSPTALTFASRSSTISADNLVQSQP
jgi:hypothetical protein